MLNYNNKSITKALKLMLWFFCFTPVLQAQVSDLNTILNKSIKKEKKIIKIDSLINNYKQKHNDSLPFLYADYATWLYENKETEKAIVTRKKALNSTDTDADFLQKNYHLLGEYLIDNIPLEAINFFDKALNINTKNNLAINTYFRLGVAYYRINNHKKAMSYWMASINLANENNIVNEQLVKAYNNIIFLQSYDINEKNYKNGIKNYKIADSISKVIVINWNLRYFLKFNIGNMYINNVNRKYLNIKKGLKYYKEALKIAKTNKDTVKIKQIYRSLSNLYSNTNYKKSIFYNNKALILTKKTDTLNLINTNIAFSISYVKNKQYKKSIKYNYKCISYSTDHNIKNYKNIDKKVLINTKNKEQLLFSFYLLAETYLKYYEQTKDLTLLEKSIACFKLTDDVLDLLLLNTKEFDSRIYWREINNNIYGKALKACYLNNNIEDAFYFIEKNKASLLIEDIVNQNNRMSKNIPTSLLEKETHLKQQLVKYKNTLENTVNKRKKDSLNKVILDTKRVLLTFQDSIYKGEKKRTINQNLSTVKSVQKQLKDNEVYITYYVTEEKEHVVYSNKENGYVIFITKNNNYFFEINNLTDLRNKVTKLINLSKKPFKNKEEFNSYNQLSFKVYNKLFPTKEIKGLIKNKKVIIAPDDYLSYLSFETLITKNNVEKSNYLIRDCTISYVYSYSFLENIIKTKTENTSFLGVAPIHFKNRSLSTLKNSENEILKLSNYYRGKTFLHQKATKSHFLKELSKHQLIHLATHANAQDSIQPWIAFNDEKINLSELYLTKNKASLVVLSGCNTTLGKEETGEGIMSLARGFFYSGSQSVVSSLWSVDDKATPYIMNEFYKNLYHGQTKSKALRNAKLSYLDHHSLSELSPHYWASFILLGKDDVLPHSAFNWYPYLIGILVVLFFFYLLFKYKINKK